MDVRFEQMQDWLSKLECLKETEFSVPEAASSDASFRRYFRIKLTEKEADNESFIIMDAPPEHEDCTAFIRVSKQLSSIGLKVPEVLAQDLMQGFLLLTDLGSQTYLSVLAESNANALYTDALTSLVVLQDKGSQFSQNLPAYDEKLLMSEMSLFDDWLGKEHLNSEMNKLQTVAWKGVQSYLAQSALAQPQVYVHRDFHSRNLMFSEQKNPGILDFQDAVKGPLTYDAISMLRDCYITWPAEQVAEWQREYFLMLSQQKMLAKDEWQGFQKSMDLMGVQRHLKASGIFARLYHRDGKENYLNDIPATLDHLTEVAENYSELHFLVNWVNSEIRPKLEG